MGRAMDEARRENRTAALKYMVAAVDGMRSIKFGYEGV
jgi:hypothetical protein